MVNQIPTPDMTGVEDVLYLTYEELLARGEQEGITMTSVLFCKHGGLIRPLTSGQNAIAGISREGLWALMQLEVVGPYADELGYLEIEDGVLKGIRPHLVGDTYVTFGFGDAIQSDDELRYYQDAMNEMDYNVELSMNVGDYEKIKNIVIPTEICFKKTIMDVEGMYAAITDHFHGMKYKLNQNEIDALIIARYQLGTLGDRVCTAVENGADKDALYNILLTAHGGQAFASRALVETNIFFDGNYDVADGYRDVIVEPLWEAGVFD